MSKTKLLHAEWIVGVKYKEDATIIFTSQSCYVCRPNTFVPKNGYFKVHLKETKRNGN